MEKISVEAKLKQVEESRAKVRRMFDELCYEIKNIRDNSPDYSPYKRERDQWNKTSIKR